MSKKNTPDSDTSVKKVEPAVSVDVNPGDGEQTQSSAGGGPIEGARNVISNVSGSVVNAVKNGFRGFRNAAGNAGRAAGHAVSNGCGRVGSFLNISKKAAAVTMACVIGLSGTALGLSAYRYHQMNILLKQEDVMEDDCAEKVENMKVACTVGDVSGLAEEYAAKAWAIGKAIGLSDEQCAGMLGNMERESGNDPTTIEAVYTDAFNIDGPVKSAAKADMCAFFRQYIIPKYISSGWGIEAHTTKTGCSVPGHAGGKYSLNTSAYEGVDGHFAPGIGLFGFTGPNSSALMVYAESGNMGWWEFDLQMAFSIDETGGYSCASWVHEWAVSGNPTTPEEAAVEWNNNFEGQDAFNDIKSANARKWYDKYHGMTGDQNYAQSVIALANQIAGGALNASVAKATNECETAKKAYDNSGIAKAAVAYAYETVDEGRGNDGTELYRSLHDIIYPASPIYQSCDVGAATAIVWAGADDSFPAHSTTEQELHMLAYPEKWELVGTLGTSVMKDDLQPGDVLVIKGGGHIVLYVGNDAVREKYPNSDAEDVSASLGERSPGCGQWWDSAMYHDSRGPYQVFRNKLKEGNPKFVDCVAGMNLDDGS